MNIKSQIKSVLCLVGSFYSFLPFCNQPNDLLIDLYETDINEVDTTRFNPCIYSINSKVCSINSKVDVINSLDTSIESKVDNVASAIDALSSCGAIAISQSQIPYTISTPGYYCAGQNITANNTSPIITIASDNVTLNLNGYTLDASGFATNAIAFDNSSPRSNIVIDNGIITGDGRLLMV